MNIQKVCILSILMISGCASVPHSSTQHSANPPNGFVPDSATDVSIAEAVLTPIYGKETIISERPFNVALEQDVWTVSGSISGRHTPQDLMFGGVAEVQISKVTGCVLFVGHTK